MTGLDRVTAAEVLAACDRVADRILKDAQHNCLRAPEQKCPRCARVKELAASPMLLSLSLWLTLRPCTDWPMSLAAIILTGYMAGHDAGEASAMEKLLAPASEETI